MDLTQILVIIILSVSVIFMTVVGFFFVQLLRELNKLIKKAHGVVEGFERMGDGLQNGFGELTGFLGGIKSVFKILEIFKKRNSSRSDEQSEPSDR